MWSPTTRESKAGFLFGARPLDAAMSGDSQLDRSDHTTRILDIDRLQGDRIQARSRSTSEGRPSERIRSSSVRLSSGFGGTAGTFHPL